jgi:hypothetical protein
MRRFALAAFLSLLLAPAASAQQEAPAAAVPPDPPSVERSLATIAELLQVLVDQQRLELALRRLDFEVTRVTALERELAATRLEREGFEREAEQVALVHETMRRQLDEAERSVGTAGDDDPGLALEVASLDLRLRQHRARVHDLEQRAIEEEGAIQERREALAALEALVDRELQRR